MEALLVIDMEAWTGGGGIREAGADREALIYKCDSSLELWISKYNCK